jgi:branched-chain amino acid transport system ATP-binding protein
MIVAEAIAKRFGGLTALDGCSLAIETGRITGLVGPNGAGKSTLFNIIAGNLKPSRGRVWLAGEDITGLPPHALYRRGLLRTFQIAHEFARMTVLENLLVAAADQRGESFWPIFFKPREVAAQERNLRAKAEEVLAFLGLEELALAPAGNLSGGQKKLLELGRTLMTEAKVVLLDEIGAGVNRTLLKRIGALIRELNEKRGCTFCLIEHDMDFVAELCDPVIVLAQGRVLAQGHIQELRRDPRVIEAYFGGGRYEASSAA